MLTDGICDIIIFKFTECININVNVHFINGNWVGQDKEGEW